MARTGKGKGSGTIAENRNGRSCRMNAAAPFPHIIGSDWDVLE